MTDQTFWRAMADLAADSPILLDRPAGSAHPRYPDMIYPLDYGYLEGTSASDGGGIDIWIGSLEQRQLTGILCTYDNFKRDVEIKLLLGCSDSNIETIIAFHSEMHTLFIPCPKETK